MRYTKQHTLIYKPYKIIDIITNNTALISPLTNTNDTHLINLNRLLPIHNPIPLKSIYSNLKYFIAKGYDIKRVPPDKYKINIQKFTPFQKARQYIYDKINKFKYRYQNWIDNDTSRHPLRTSYYDVSTIPNI